METPIFQAISEYKEELISIRRHLHQNPELSFQEYATTQYIQQILEKWGIHDFYSLADTGLIVEIKGQNPSSKCIALRADIDALPILELSSIDYKSVNDGVMHACGHDVHTTCLLGAIYYLHSIRSTFYGTIKCIFQAGEELSPGGASILIEKGVLENPQVESIIGLHVFPELKYGNFGFRPGPYMASADEIHITILGKSGHAALPHKNHDPLDITQHILSLLQSQIIKKNNPLNPCVLNFGQIRGGDSTNVIPDSVTMKGTLRTFDEEWRNECIEIIHKTCKALSELFDVKINVHIPQGYPFLKNDETLTNKIIRWAHDIMPKEKIHKIDMRMTAEDFSFYAQKIPACFFRLGTNNELEEHSTPVHNNRFNIDENSIIYGSTMFSFLALKLLED